MPSLPHIDGWEWRFDKPTGKWALHQTHGKLSEIIARLTPSGNSPIVRKSVSGAASVLTDASTSPPGSPVSARTSVVSGVRLSSTLQATIPDISVTGTPQPIVPAPTLLARVSPPPPYANGVQQVQPQGVSPPPHRPVSYIQGGLPTGPPFYIPFQQAQPPPPPTPILSVHQPSELQTHPSLRVARRPISATYQGQPVISGSAQDPRLYIQQHPGHNIRHTHTSSHSSSATNTSQHVASPQLSPAELPASTPALAYAGRPLFAVSQHSSTPASTHASSSTPTSGHTATPPPLVAPMPIQPAMIAQIASLPAETLAAGNTLAPTPSPAPSVTAPSQHSIPTATQTSMHPVSHYPSESSHADPEEQMLKIGLAQMQVMQQVSEHQPASSTDQQSQPQMHLQQPSGAINVELQIQAQTKPHAQVQPATYNFDPHTGLPNRPAMPSSTTSTQILPQQSVTQILGQDQPPALTHTVSAPQVLQTTNATTSVAAAGNKLLSLGRGVGKGVGRWITENPKTAIAGAALAEVGGLALGVDLFKDARTANAGLNRIKIAQRKQSQAAAGKPGVATSPTTQQQSSPASPSTSASSAQVLGQVPPQSQHGLSGGQTMQPSASSTSDSLTQAGLNMYQSAQQANGSQDQQAQPSSNVQAAQDASVQQQLMQQQMFQQQQLILQYQSQLQQQTQQQQGQFNSEQYQQQLALANQTQQLLGQQYQVAQQQQANQQYNAALQQQQLSQQYDAALQQQLTQQYDAMEQQQLLSQPAYSNQTYGQPQYVQQPNGQYYVIQQPAYQSIVLENSAPGTNVIADASAVNQVMQYSTIADSAATSQLDTQIVQDASLGSQDVNVGSTFTTTDAVGDATYTDTTTTMTTNGDVAILEQTTTEYDLNADGSCDISTETDVDVFEF